jgi:hypothetical protein
VFCCYLLKALYSKCFVSHVDLFFLMMDKYISLFLHFIVYIIEPVFQLRFGNNAEEFAAPFKVLSQHLLVEIKEITKNRS